MKDAEYQRFFDVTMPGWYRKTALVIRVIGGLIALVCAWWMARQPPESWMWPIIGILVGCALMVIPSLPKAYVEQRNRIRGLRDGNFQKNWDDKQKEES